MLRRLKKIVLRFCFMFCFTATLFAADIVIDPYTLIEVYRHDSTLRDTTMLLSRPHYTLIALRGQLTGYTGPDEEGVFFIFVADMSPRLPDQLTEEAVGVVVHFLGDSGSAITIIQDIIYPNTIRSNDKRWVNEIVNLVNLQEIERDRESVTTVLSIKGFMKKMGWKGLFNVHMKKGSL